MVKRIYGAFLPTTKWNKVYYVIMAFYLNDFFTTLVFCTDITLEQGYLPRIFMEATDSVYLGLLFNIVFMVALWKILFYYSSKFDNILRNYNIQIAKIIETVSFTLLAFFPALSFYAATSWYILKYDNYRLGIGAALYFVSLKWVKPLGPRVRDLEAFHF